MNRLRLYLVLAIGFAGLSAFIGSSYGVVVPYTAAEGLEEAIRGADTPDEVRSRIVDYYSAHTANRLLLFVTPGLAAAIAAALALYEVTKQRNNAANGS